MNNDKNLPILSQHDPEMPSVVITEEEILSLLAELKACCDPTDHVPGKQFFFKGHKVTYEEATSSYASRMAKKGIHVLGVVDIDGFKVTSGIDYSGAYQDKSALSKSVASAL